jgi:hypothetical protein
VRIVGDIVYRCEELPIEFVCQIDRWYRLNVLSDTAFDDYVGHMPPEAAL